MRILKISKVSNAEGALLVRSTASEGALAHPMSGKNFSPAHSREQFPVFPCHFFLFFSLIDMIAEGKRRRRGGPMTNACRAPLYYAAQ